MRRIGLVLLVVILAGLGILAWDVYQLRALRPPPGATFETIVRERRPTGYRIHEPSNRLIVRTWPARTVIPSVEGPAYVFDGSGRLVDWSPGAENGMISGAPIPRGGRDLTLDQAREWLKARR